MENTENISMEDAKEELEKEPQPENLQEITNETEYEKEGECEKESAFEPPLPPLPPLDTRNRFSRFCANYAWLGFAFLIPVFVMFILYALNGTYPFGTKSPLVLDANAQYAFFFKALRNWATGESTSFIYSFSRPMGGEFTGIYAYYLASPLSWLVCLFPGENIQEAMQTLFILKTGLASLTFCWYLQKTQKDVNRLLMLLLGIAYGLSGYMIVQQNNTMWMDALILLPLVVYGVEELIKYGHFRFFVISLALTICSNYYIGYMVCLFVALYFFYYYFANNENNRNNPTAENRHFLRSFIRIASYSLLAAGICAFMIFAAYYSLTFGKTTFSSANWMPSLKFNLADLIAKFFPASYDTVRPEGVPFVYCGVLTVLLVPLFFCSKKFTFRERMAALILLLFFLVSFSFSDLDLIWHGFQTPNWINGRYSFIFCFLLLVLACRAISGLQSIATSTVAVVGFCLIGTLVAVQYWKEYDNTHMIASVMVSIVLVSVYGICLACTRRSKPWVTRAISVAMLLLTVGELAMNGVITMKDMDKDIVYGTYSDYYDQTNTQMAPVVNAVLAGDSSFYRMEKTYHRKPNDNMALGIYGLTGSSSTLNAQTLAFLNKLGYSATSFESYHIGNTPVNDALLGVKYILSKTPVADCELLFDQVGEYGVYLNPYYLPLAYGADDAVLDIDLSAYKTPFERTNALITALLGESETVQVYKPAQLLKTSTYNVSHEVVDDEFGVHDRYDIVDTEDKGSISYRYKIDVDAEYYWYAPCYYTRAVGLTVNGVLLSSFNGKYTSRIIDVGAFLSADSTATIKVDVIPEDDGVYYKQAGFYFSDKVASYDSQYYAYADVDYLWYVDTAVLADAVARLRSTAFVIEEDYQEDNLCGTLTTTKENQLIFTTVAYDTGWHIYVDGKPVTLEQTCDALVAFHVDEIGEHTVQMRYFPTCYTVGIILSLLCLLIFILLCIFRNKIRQWLPKLGFMGALFLLPLTFAMNAGAHESDVTATAALSPLPFLRIGGVLLLFIGLFLLFWHFFKKEIKAFCAAHKYLIPAFAVPFAIMFLLYSVRGTHPFGNSTVLVLDLNAQYVNFFGALRDWVYGGNTSLIYSFNRALGGEFFGIYAYYLASPLSYLVCLLPKVYMQEALEILFLLKTGLCSATFAFYLHRTRPRLGKSALLVFGIMYSLCAYCVVHQNNTMWIDAVFWLPLIALGVEQLIKYGRFRLFTISLTIAVMSNFYIGYMLCIFVAAYFFFYYFALSGNWRNNPYRERMHFLRSLLRMGTYSLLAIGMCCVVIWTAYYSLSFGKNTFSDPSWTPVVQFKFADLLYKFLPASYDNVRPNGLPFVYCGVLTLILVPAYFFCPRFSFREKIASLAFIGFFVFSFAFSNADLVWHGFQRPNWLNYRYSFMLCFFLLVLAAKAFDKIETINTVTIPAFSLVIVGLCVFFQMMNELDILHDLACIWMTIALAVGYAVILWFFMNPGQSKKAVTVSLIAVVCVETIINGVVCMNDFNNDVVYGRYSDYMDNMNLQLLPAVEAVKAQDASFFRMEKTYHRKPNDNMMLGMHGISSSTSTLNAETIHFLYNMGYSAASHWSKYYGGTVANDALLGIKYILSKTEVPNCEEVMQVGDYFVYENPYYLSLAYGVDEAILSLDLSVFNSPIDRLNAIYTALLGEETTVEIFKPATLVSTTTSNVVKATSSGHTRYTRLNKSEPGTITFHYNIEADGEYYWYAPAYYTRAVKIAVNGITVSGFNEKETTRIIDLGAFAAGDNDVQVTVTINNDYNQFYVYPDQAIVYQLDTETLGDAIERLRQTQLVIEDNYQEDDLRATLTTHADDQLIFTTIPYDEGWHIYVDGEEIPLRKTCDALIAFSVDSAGDHAVELKYSPTCWRVGLLISLFFVVLFLLICIFRKKLCRVKWIRVFYCCERCEKNFLPKAVPPSAATAPPEAGEGGGDAEEIPGIENHTDSLCISDSASAVPDSCETSKENSEPKED